MEIDQDTCEWLGCATPLEMYKHQCALLEDEINDLQRQLKKARNNVAGLVQMNEALLAANTTADRELKTALEKISNLEPSGTQNFRSVDILRDQRDYLFRENQRMAMELLVYKQPLA